MKLRLDQAMTKQGLVQSRSQAQNLINLGKVKVAGKEITKPGYMVTADSMIEIVGERKYVSRAAYKLQSVAKKLKINFKDTTVLDVGSSTGGFTDFALQNGAKRVIAVDVGTDQLHPSLRGDERIELHEKTDIREFKTDEKVDLVVIDVSFISMREVLPSVAKLSTKNTQIIAMLKPQFEAGKAMKNKGVVKNDTMRRKILKDFEQWARRRFVVVDKADSDVTGLKGNKERFYHLKII